MSDQIKRLPKIPIWDNWSIAKAFLMGLVIGILLGLIV